MRKLWILPALLLLVCAVCGQAGGQKEAKGGVTITFMTWDSGKGYEITQDAVARFEERNPGVKVELQSVPEGYDDKVMTAHAAGNTPDGLLMWNTSQFAEAGVVQDLSPWIQKEGFSLEQYLPVTSGWTRYKGGTWGLPKDYTPRVIYYNRKVFDEVGVPYPQAGWTFADFKATVRQLTNGRTGKEARYGYVAIPGHTYALQQYIWGNGGDLCSPDGRTASGFIDSAAVAEVVQWYKELYDLSISTGTMDAYQNLGQMEFQSGVVGLMDNGIWPLATFEQDKSISFGVVPPPVPRKGMALSPVIHSSTWSMFAKAANKEETWKLIKFLASADAVRILNASHWGIPAIPSLAEEMGFTSDPLLKTFVDVGNQAKVTPVFVRNPKWFEADREFQVALEKIFISNADIRPALQEAAGKMDRILQGR